MKIEKESLQAPGAEPLEAAVLVARVLPEAVIVMAETLLQGAKDHPPGDWRAKGVEGNVLHAADHLDTAERVDRALWKEDHLAHALVRTAMAVQLREEGRGDTTD